MRKKLLLAAILIAAPLSCFATFHSGTGGIMGPAKVGLGTLLSNPMAWAFAY